MSSTAFTRAALGCLRLSSRGRTQLKVRCFGIYDTVVGSTYESHATLTSSYPDQLMMIFTLLSFKRTEAQLEAGKKQFRESLAELSTLEKFRYKEFKSVDYTQNTMLMGDFTDFVVLMALFQLMEKWSKKAGATGWKQNLPSFMQSGV
eukprot:jgi/Bigna1/76952/fgenesh1_pg.44_\